MSTQRHIVKRQVIELTVGRATDAQRLQTEVSRIYRQRIVPLIDQCCTAFSAPDRMHRIPVLEIDLGQVDLRHLEETLVARIREQLHMLLADEISAQDHHATTPGTDSKTTSQLELFSLFAQTGSLPWWADGGQPHLLEDCLYHLLQYAPEPLGRVLRELAHDSRCLQRLIQHYGDASLADLCGVLVPTFRGSLVPLLTDFMAVLQTATIPTAGRLAQRRTSAWSTVLSLASLRGQDYREPFSFYRELLPRLARVWQVTPAVLLAVIRQALRPGPIPGRAGLEALVERLAHALPTASSRAAASLPALLAQWQRAGGALASLAALITPILVRVPAHEHGQWLAVLAPLAHWFSHRVESLYGQTPSPSMGEGKGRGEARHGFRRPSLPLPPHPLLGATASAQGRQALPPPGGKGPSGTDVPAAQATPGAPALREALHGLQALLQSLLTSQRLPAAVLREWRDTVRVLAADHRLAAVVSPLLPLLDAAGREASEQDDRAHTSTDVPDAAARALPALLARWQRAGDILASLAALLTPILAWVPAREYDPWLAVLASLERWASHHPESLSGVPPSPSTPSHPPLGATASAQGRQPLPPPGGKGPSLTDALELQTTPGAPELREALHGLQALLQTLLTQQRLPLAVVSEWLGKVRVLAAEGRLAAVVLPLRPLLEAAGREASEQDDRARPSTDVPDAAATPLPALLARWQHAGGILASLAALLTPILAWVPAREYGPWLAVLAPLEHWPSHRSESLYGSTPSPSIPPHPTLGATASAQGRQPLPPPGGKRQYVTDVTESQAVPGAPALREALHGLQTLLQTLLTQQRLPSAVVSEWLWEVQQVAAIRPTVEIVQQLKQWLEDALPDTSLPVEPAEDRPADLRFSDADELYIDNAGLVLLWPFLERFFERLGLVTAHRFRDVAAVHRAVGLLQYLASADPSPPEYLLPLNKVLCGMALDEVWALDAPLTEAEAEECTDLLTAVIAHAPILHNMSLQGFRGTFLLRQGVLSARDGAWLLRVQRETYDVVMDRFPWSVAWVKLPWMETLLRVEW